MGFKVPDNIIRALIVDSDLNTRMRLRAATTAVPAFGQVLQDKTIQEATRTLSGDAPLDIVFISYRFGEAEIREFIQKGKNSPQGSMAAYVLILHPRDQTASRIATDLTVGTDGFLCDPYSIDDLGEILHLAGKVRQQRAETRQRIAIDCLIEHSVQLINEMALKRLAGLPPGNLIRSFDQVRSSFAEIPMECHPYYFEQLLSVFTSTPLPKEFHDAQERIGASKRVQELIEKRRAQMDEAREKARQVQSDGAFRIVKK